MLAFNTNPGHTKTHLSVSYKKSELMLMRRATASV